MTLRPTLPDFSALLSNDHLMSLMSELDSYIVNHCPELHSIKDNDYVSCIADKLDDPSLLKTQLCPIQEIKSVDALLRLFNTLFAKQNVMVVRSTGEPEYFAATYNKPAQITFAHGFFASALHEISHWCIAGQARRQSNDFGYWYAPDGRNHVQQAAFERVEIKPQALECLFTLACQRSFSVSEDNLFADFETSDSRFALNVYEQALNYINNPNTMPRDAKVLLWALLLERQY